MAEGRFLALRREPVVPFLLFGALFSLAWSAWRPDGVETVRIEAAALRVAEARQSELLGRPLTDAERAELIAAYIDDEVLIHEAARRGLHWSDGRVRQRLVRLMRGSLTTAASEPSRAELEQHLREHASRFCTPESFTFELITFPWGTELPKGEIDKSNPSVRKRVSRSSLVVTLGPEVADAIESMPTAVWRGPIESPSGRFVVRVLERHAAEEAKFDEVESYVRQDWLMGRTRELQQDRIDEIRQTYRLEYVDE